MIFIPRAHLLIRHRLSTIQPTWINPGPAYPYSWAEGPVMWKYKGYYYYCFAHDLSGGQYIFRSSTLTDYKYAWTDMGNFFSYVFNLLLKMMLNIITR